MHLLEGDLLDKVSCRVASCYFNENVLKTKALSFPYCEKFTSKEYGFGKGV
jgi:hypothetical protein